MGKVCFYISGTDWIMKSVCFCYLGGWRKKIGHVAGCTLRPCRTRLTFFCVKVCKAASHIKYVIWYRALKRLVQRPKSQGQKAGCRGRASYKILIKDYKKLFPPWNIMHWQNRPWYLYYESK